MGNMMRYGMPNTDYPKLPWIKIELIRNLGVKIVTNKSIGTHITLADLQGF